MKPIDKDLLRALHRPCWAGTGLFGLYAILFYAMQGLAVWCLVEGWYLALAPIILVLTFLMHAFLLAFHESAHDNLCPWKPANEFLGILVGSYSFMSWTLYRTCHHWHHAWLADRRDEELWPFNDPKASRGLRLLAATLELCCGLIYTPLLFVRSFLRSGSVITEPARRRRIWMELAGLATVWAGVLVAVTLLGWWGPFAVAYLIPAWLAGCVQSWRKYIEHMGLTGQGVLAGTRSVRTTTLGGRLLSWSLFHEPLHDVHHLYPRLPQSSLPDAAQAEEPVPAEVPVFRSYRHAMWDLLRCLPNPRVGEQWHQERRKDQAA